MRTLLKFLTSSVLLVLLVASIFRFELHSLYVHHYVFSKVNVLQLPVINPRAGKVELRNFCSGSQIRYKGQQFTITNLHCCAVADRSLPPFLLNELGQVGLVGRELYVDGIPRKILNVSRNHDLCLLEPDLTQRAFSLAWFTYLQEPVTVIGHPRGLPRTIRSGHIISEDSAIFPWLHIIDRPYTLLSTITYGGNSGSPVINLFGSVVGLIFAGFSDSHTEGMMVPLSSVKRFLEEYVSKSK